MRHSQFWDLLEGEVGRTYAATLAKSLHLTPLSGRTAAEALDAGVPPREVWVALCDAMDVPPERRFGVERPGRRR